MEMESEYYKPYLKIFLKDGVDMDKSYTKENITARNVINNWATDYSCRTNGRDKL
jgi:hypothetical protein